MQEVDVRQDLTTSRMNWKCIGVKAQLIAYSWDVDAKARITDVYASHLQRDAEGPVELEYETCKPNRAHLLCKVCSLIASEHMLRDQ